MSGAWPLKGGWGGTALNMVLASVRDSWLSIPPVFEFLAGRRSNPSIAGEVCDTVSVRLDSGVDGGSVRRLHFDISWRPDLEWIILFPLITFFGGAVQDDYSPDGSDEGIGRRRPAEGTVSSRVGILPEKAGAANSTRTGNRHFWRPIRFNDSLERFSHIRPHVPCPNASHDFHITYTNPLKK